MPRRRKGKGRFCVLPGYNWCGQSCSGSGAPINDVDAACKAHDECYQKGRKKCECDREFLRLLQPKLNAYSQEGRHARLLYNYMKLQTAYTCKPYRN